MRGFRADHLHHRPSRWAYVSWRYAHRRNTKEQQRVAEVLATDWRADVARIGRRMRRCADGFMAAVDLRTAAVGVCPMHCDVGICPACLEHGKRTTLKKARYCVAESVEAGDMLRHLVVTSPTAVGSVREAADRLAVWYRRLTRRTAWRSRVRASMAVFETTWSHGSEATEDEPAKPAGWHWHAHIITVGQWWRAQCKGPDGNPCDPSQCDCVKLRGCCGRDADGCDCEAPGRRNRPDLRCLMQEWYQVTNGAAHIVHVSAAGKDHRGRHLGDQETLLGDPVNEAVKYPLKTMALPDHALIQYIAEMRSFQRVRWGGEWYGMQPPEEHEGVPRVMVCPTELWRLSTGMIGSLLARLTRGDVLTVEQVEASGWTVYRFAGPVRPGRGRPPPLIELTQDFATRNVEALESTIAELASKLPRLKHPHPTQGLDLDGIHLPY